MLLSLSWQFSCLLSVVLQYLSTSPFVFSSLPVFYSLRVDHQKPGIPTADVLLDRISNRHGLVVANIPLALASRPVSLGATGSTRDQRAQLLDRRRHLEIFVADGQAPWRI